MKSKIKRLLTLLLVVSMILGNSSMISLASNDIMPVFQADEQPTSKGTDRNMETETETVPESTAESETLPEEEMATEEEAEKETVTENETET